LSRLILKCISQRKSGGNIKFCGSKILQEIFYFIFYSGFRGQIKKVTDNYGKTNRQPVKERGRNKFAGLSVEAPAWQGTKV